MSITYPVEATHKKIDTLYKPLKILRPIARKTLLDRKKAMKSEDRGYTEEKKATTTAILL